MAEQKTKSRSRGRKKGVNVSELRGRPVGRILTKMGKVTRDQVQEAMDLQKQRRMPVGQILIELNYVSDEDVNAALAAQAGMESLDLESVEISDETITALPAETANAYQCIPVQYDADKNHLTVAIQSADNFRAMDDLRLLMGYAEVKAVVADPKQVEDRLKKWYSDDQESISSLIGELGEDERYQDLGEDASQSIDLDELMTAVEDNKVKRLLNLVLLQAIKDRASDIHLEPFEDEFKMRMRVDGIMYEMVPPPKQLAWALTSRVKVMADLDIAERRLPQDGRIELMVGGRPVDMRISVLPTMFGESVVMRVLDRSNVSLDLEKVGMRDEELEEFRQVMSKPNGIVILTGPTGSGKTTTLYSALYELNDIETKILTSEDPVEYDITGLVQVQINEEIGLTFARSLRHFLRQDPDVILVGEIRDLDTAQIAVQASLTGHLVFTTLHTNDAPSSIARLLDLGVEPFLVTATLEAIVAQRLVRRICNYCQEQYTPTEEELLELDLSPEDVEGRTFTRGRGCERCNRTGYRGRMGIFEMMMLDDDLKELIMQHASTNVLRNEARKRGMRTLRQSGLTAIYEGKTTIEEVVRETVMEED